MAMAMALLLDQMPITILLAMATEVIALPLLLANRILEGHHSILPEVPEVLL